MKHKRKQELESKIKKEEGEISTESLIQEVKKEVLAEVRLVSTGISTSLYKLVEMDKELAELEKELENKIEA
jgi:hypothetical protein